MSSLLTGGSKQSSSSKSSSKQSTKVVLPSYLQEVVPSIVDRANSLSLTNYTPYTDQRFANFTPEQLQAFQGVQDMQGDYQPLIEQAMAAMMQTGEGITPEMIQEWMNPYQQNVTDITKRETLRDFDVLRNQIGDTAATAGAFGGDRMGILESEAYRNVGQNLTDIQAKGSYDAYNNAVQTAIQNQQLLQSAGVNAMNVASGAQRYNLADLAALENVGAQKQAFDQAGMDFDYAQFQEQQQWPYQQLGFLSSMINPILEMTRGSSTKGSSTSSSTQTQSSTMSPLSAIAGLASTAMGMPGVGSMLGSALGGMGMGAATGSMGGLGSILGSLGGGIGSGYMSSMITNPALGNITGMSAYNPVLGMSKYKKGGLVKKYAEGGGVNLRGYLPPYLQLLLDSGGLGYNTAKGLTSAKTPLKEDKSEMFPMADLKKYIIDQELIGEATNGRAGRKLIGPDIISDQFEEVPIDNNPEEVTSDALISLLNDFTSQQEPDESEDVFDVEQTSPKTPETTKDAFEGYNLPLLKLGARMLASPGESFFEALGHGMESFIAGKTEQNNAAIKGKQAAFDNELAAMKTATYAKQVELQDTNNRMREELQPFVIDKTKAEATKALADANFKKAMGSNRALAFSELVKSPDFMYAPKEQQAQMLNDMTQLLQQKSSEEAGSGSTEIVEGQKYKGPDGRIYQGKNGQLVPVQ